jgi:hypothetical protein
MVASVIAEFEQGDETVAQSHNQPTTSLCNAQLSPSF